MVNKDILILNQLKQILDNIGIEYNIDDSLKKEDIILSNDIIINCNYRKKEIRMSFNVEMLPISAGIITQDIINQSDKKYKIILTEMFIYNKDRKLLIGQEAVDNQINEMKDRMTQLMIKHHAEIELLLNHEPFEC